MGIKLRKWWYRAQFGVMANAFVSSRLGMENPKIGLLSIGEEGGKGNEQVRLARKLLEKAHLTLWKVWKDGLHCWVLMGLESFVVEALHPGPLKWEPCM